jgi:histidine triad (HIT) family protein
MGIDERRARMTKDPSCIFCQIITGQVEANIVYRDEIVTAFMDNRPINPGHLLVVPNRHASSLGEMDDEVGGHMFVIGRKLALALRRSGLRCSGVNLFMADGAAAGQTVFHSHLHVVPRYTGDGFGFHFPPGYAKGASNEDLNQVAVKVRAVLEENQIEAQT